MPLWSIYIDATVVPETERYDAPQNGRLFCWPARCDADGRHNVTSSVTFKICANRNAGNSGHFRSGTALASYLGQTPVLGEKEKTMNVLERIAPGTAYEITVHKMPSGNVSIRQGENDDTVNVIVIPESFIRDVALVLAASVRQLVPSEG